MAITYIKLKNGKEYSGAIKYWRPCFNWFTLYDIDKTFSFDECESIITPEERVSINSPIEGEICDEMLRAYKELEDGRKYGWEEDGQSYPKEKWKWENNLLTECM